MVQLNTVISRSPLAPGVCRVHTSRRAECAGATNNRIPSMAESASSSSRRVSGPVSMATRRRLEWDDLHCSAPPARAGVRGPWFAHRGARRSSRAARAGGQHVQGAAIVRCTSRLACAVLVAWTVAAVGIRADGACRRQPATSSSSRWRMRRCRSSSADTLSPHRPVEQRADLSAAKPSDLVIVTDAVPVLITSIRRRWRACSNPAAPC